MLNQSQPYFNFRLFMKFWACITFKFERFKTENTTGMIVIRASHALCGKRCFLSLNISNEKTGCENWHDRSISESSKPKTTSSFNIQCNKLIYIRRKHRCFPETNLIPVFVMFPFLSQYLRQKIHNSAFSIQMKINFLLQWVCKFAPSLII